ncbi:MAG: GNAT family protein [Candidatus Aenigmatarchaeota archaeon]
MKLPKINGDNVYIRQLHESDFKDFAKTRESKEFTIMCGGSKKWKPTPLNKVKERFKEAIAQKSELSFAIIKKSDNKYIGSCRLHQINKQDKNVRLAIGILQDYFGKGYGTDAINCILKFGFIQLKLHKISLVVLDFNKRAIAAYKKCGFKVDGILRDNAYIDGKFYNDLIMSILDSEFKMRSAE